MIVSHSKKFAFCRIPKCASNAVGDAFAKSLVAGDICIPQTDFVDTSAVYTNILPSIKDLSKPPSPHMRLCRASEFGIDIGKDYLKVFVVRNPYDKFISACVNVVRRRAKALRTENVQDKITSKILLDAYEMETMSIEFDNYDWFMDGEEPARVLRFENLQADFDAVSDELGISRVTLDHVYPGLIGQSKYRALYTPELRAHVERIHARDFERFGYSW